jgi:hypothetical protein
MNLINDSFIDDIITNLKIIGMIEKNNKLSIKNGHLKLDKIDNFQFLRRWFNRDSRDQTILFLKNIIKNVSELINRLDNFTESDKNWIIKRIVNELEKVEIGIKNLKVTYVDDSFILVNLDNILCKLKEIVRMNKIVDIDSIEKQENAPQIQHYTSLQLANSPSNTASNISQSNTASNISQSNTASNTLSNISQSNTQPTKSKLENIHDKNIKESDKGAKDNK